MLVTRLLQRQRLVEYKTAGTREAAHLALLLAIGPKFVLEGLEGVSSRMIRKKNYPSISKKLWAGALWSPSYFAGSCGGAPIEIIRQYIERQ